MIPATISGTPIKMATQKITVFIRRESRFALWLTFATVLAGPRPTPFALLSQQPNALVLPGSHARSGPYDIGRLSKS